MQALEETLVSCPYCGEKIAVLVDCSDAGDQYVEDCQVCCRPIRMRLHCDEEGRLLRLDVSGEND